MKISEVIEELEQARKLHGEIEVALQDCPSSGEPVTGYESFFIVPEEYDGDDGSETVCNIRWWPY